MINKMNAESWKKPSTKQLEASINERGEPPNIIKLLTFNI
jgi:hypothetical protein